MKPLRGRYWRMGSSVDRHTQRFCPDRPLALLGSRGKQDHNRRELLVIRSVRWAKIMSPPSVLKMADNALTIRTAMLDASHVSG